MDSAAVGDSAGTSAAAGDSVAVVGHLGLGDAIVLSGMVRTLCAARRRVAFFAKKPYASSLSTLFAGCDNLELVLVDEVDDALRQLRAFRAARPEYEVLRLGAYAGDPCWSALDPSWARCFYLQAGLPPDLMYDAFRWGRDPDRELARRVEELVGGEDYAVVHDDLSRGMALFLPASAAPAVHVDDPRIRRDDIFAYLEVLRRAAQVHAIDSCFLLMCDFAGLTLEAPPGKFFCHAYAKDPAMPALYRGNVRILRDPTEALAVTWRKGREASNA